MHRRPLSRGRRIAIAGSVLMLIGCLLPWYGVGGAVGELTRITFHAFDGSGLLTFLASLAVLGLVALPYAMIDRPAGVDRPLLYVVFGIVGIAGVVLWIQIWLQRPEGVLPDRAPGYWLAVVGVLILARGAYEIWFEPAER